MKQYRNTVQAIQNTVNTYVYTHYQNTNTIVKTPTHTLTHTLQNNHSTRYTPNKVVTIQSSTLNI